MKANALVCLLLIVALASASCPTDYFLSAGDGAGGRTTDGEYDIYELDLSSTGAGTLRLEATYPSTTAVLMTSTCSEVCTAASGGECSTTKSASTYKVKVTAAGSGEQAYHFATRFIGVVAPATGKGTVISSGGPPPDDGEEEVFVYGGDGTPNEDNFLYSYTIDKDGNIVDITINEAANEQDVFDGLRGMGIEPETDTAVTPGDSTNTPGTPGAPTSNRFSVNNVYYLHEQDGEINNIDEVSIQIELLNNGGNTIVKGMLSSPYDSIKVTPWLNVPMLIPGHCYHDQVNNNQKSRQCWIQPPIPGPPLHITTYDTAPGTYYLDYTVTFVEVLQREWWDIVPNTLKFMQQTKQTETIKVPIIVTSCSNDGHCEPNQYCGFDQRCHAGTPSIRLVFVPVNWDSAGLNGFQTRAENHVDGFLDNVGLDGCRDDVGVSYILDDCVIGVQNNPNLGDLIPLNPISTCAFNNLPQRVADSWRASISNDQTRIFGVSDSNDDPNLGGYTRMNHHLVHIDGDGDRLTTAHEIGHTWGLWDEYCCFLAGSGTVNAVDANTCFARSLPGLMTNYCLGMGADTQNPLSRGMTNAGGGIGIMHNVPTTPEGYSTRSLAHLNTRGFLHC